MIFYTAVGGLGSLVVLQTAEAVVLDSNPASLTMNKTRRIGSVTQEWEWNLPKRPTDFFKNHVLYKLIYPTYLIKFATDYFLEKPRNYQKIFFFLGGGRGGGGGGMAEVENMFFS